jgi:hypothetical protein
MPAVFFITHLGVAIDASARCRSATRRGRTRMRAMAVVPWIKVVLGIFASS